MLSLKESDPLEGIGGVDTIATSNSSPHLPTPSEKLIRSASDFMTKIPSPYADASEGS